MAAILTWSHLGKLCFDTPTGHYDGTISCIPLASSLQSLRVHEPTTSLPAEMRRLYILRTGEDRYILRGLLASGHVNMEADGEAVVAEIERMLAEGILTGNSHIPIGRRKPGILDRYHAVRLGAKRERSMQTSPRKALRNEEDASAGGSDFDDSESDDDLLAVACLANLHTQISRVPVR